MKLITKIACRTAGTLGMGKALYEAYKVGSYYSVNGAEYEQAKYLQKAFYDGRTVDTVSYTSNDVRRSAFDLRTKNPIPSLWGKITGAIKGASYALSDNLGTIICASAAILGKGALAKIGAIGIGVNFVYQILREGFGLGKQHPME